MYSERLAGLLYEGDGRLSSRLPLCHFLFLWGWSVETETANSEGSGAVYPGRSWLSGWFGFGSGSWAPSPELLSSRLGESSTPGSGAAWGCNISHINHLQPLLGTFINNQQSVSLVKINHVTLQFLNFLLGLELHFHIQGIQLHVITELVKMCD